MAKKKKSKYAQKQKRKWNCKGKPDPNWMSWFEPRKGSKDGK